MAFADKVIHVTLSGNMFGGQEEWQTGFYMGLSEGAPDVPTTAFTNAVRDAWVTFFRAPTSGISEAYSFTQVKAVRLGTDGKYDGSAPAVSNPATTILGPVTGFPLPPQIALVATLVAGSGKGLAGKGRMYLPGVKLNVEGNGRIQQTQVQSVATNLATFFNTINASFDAPGRVINASKGATKFAGLGARNVPVNGVRVGNVYDTQRRRRNGLSETYSTAVVAD